MWQALAFLFEEDLGKAEVPARLLLSGAWPARWGPGGEGGAHWGRPCSLEAEAHVSRRSPLAQGSPAWSGHPGLGPAGQVEGDGPRGPGPFPEFQEPEVMGGGGQTAAKRGQASRQDATLRPEVDLNAEGCLGTETPTGTTQGSRCHLGHGRWRGALSRITLTPK